MSTASVLQVSIVQPCALNFKIDFDKEIQSYSHDLRVWKSREFFWRHHTPIFYLFLI